MKIVTDLSVTSVPARARQPWSAGRLFAAGARGACFTPSDPATLFIDAAMTVPVSGPGDPVGAMADTSGQGNHAVQPVSAARPALRQDDEGHAYLEFDGLDDWMETAPVDMTGVPAATMIVAFETATPISLNSPVLQFRALAGTSAADPSMAIVAGDGSQDAVRARFFGAAANQSARLPIASPHKGLYTLRAASAKVGAAEIDLRRNGAFLGGGSGTDSGVTGFGARPLAIGAYPGGGNPFCGRLYGGLLIGEELAGAGLASAERFYAGKAGITL